MKNYFLHLKLNHRDLLYKLAVGFAVTAGLIASTSVSAEPGRVVALSGHNWVWTTSGTIFTFAPDSGGPNIECQINGSESKINDSVGGTMALIAMQYDSQFTEVNISCSDNTIEIALARSGNQAYFYYDYYFGGGSSAIVTTYEFFMINGVNCFTASAGQAAKVALAMATGRPMTATCTPNPYTGENVLDIVY